MKYVDYLWNLLKFAFRANHLLYLSILVSIFSVAVELLAMGSLMPLFDLMSHNYSASNTLITEFLMRLGFQPKAEVFFGAFLILLTIRILTQLIAQSLTNYLGRRVMAQLASQAFQQIIEAVSIKDIGKKNIGYFISLAGDETFRASMLVIAVTQFISHAALAIFYFAAIINYSTTVASMVAAFLLFAGLTLTGVVIYSHRLGSRQFQESREASSIFLDGLNNLKAVRAFAAEKYVVEQYRSLIFRYAKTLYLVDSMSLLMRLLPVLLLLLILGLWFIWAAIPLETLGLSFVVTGIVYLMRFFPVVGQCVTTLMRISSDAKAGKDVTHVIGINWISADSSQKLDNKITSIEFKDVYFAYGDLGEKQVLNGINYRFETGKSYALAGRSGIGKSTLMDVLLKFYALTSGHININGVDINNISTNNIRKRAILVSQDTAIFDDTVINNICFGTEAQLTDIKTACTQACIHDEIEALPLGYHTRLQYQGKNLSGGQRQRIAIARGLLRNPDVLIFDESTSALDKATQSRIVDNILKACADKIVIFVTHDPYIMNRVDNLVDFGSINPVLAETK